MLVSQFHFFCFFSMVLGRDRRKSEGIADQGPAMLRRHKLICEVADSARAHLDRLRTVAAWAEVKCQLLAAIWTK